MDLIDFDDDIIDTYRHTAPFSATPERRLWVCVLKLTIKDIEDHKFTELLEWLESDDFKFICNAVGCRPGEAAQHLREVYCD